LSEDQRISYLEEDYPGLWKLGATGVGFQSGERNAMPVMVLTANREGGVLWDFKSALNDMVWNKLRSMVFKMLQKKKY